MSEHDDDGRAQRAAEDERRVSELGPDAGYWAARFALGSPVVLLCLEPSDVGRWMRSASLWDSVINMLALWPRLAIGSALALMVGYAGLRMAHAVWRRFVPIK